MRTNCRGERGQSLVELAVFVPVMLLILVIAVDFGRLFAGWVQINNMARIGANYAALNPDGWLMTGSAADAKKARYETLMEADAQRAGCSLPEDLPDPVFLDPAPNTYSIGSRVEVTVECEFPMLIPLLWNLVGDGSGNVPVTATTTFVIRANSSLGGPDPNPPPTAQPTASPAPTSEPSPAATPDPSASVDPSASPTATLPLVEISFYGDPTSPDSSGGGPPGSPNENQIVGIPTLSVMFRNTTVGDRIVCLWDFGDGTYSTSCDNDVSKSYSARGTYSVTLTVNAQFLTRSQYVLVSCKVPDFHNVRKNNATSLWTSYGFSEGNISFQDGTGNYLIMYQSIASGLVNPPGGCEGAVIEVGP